MGDGKQEPSLYDVYEKLNDMDNTLKNSCKLLDSHQLVLFGTPQAQDTGLMWRVSKNERDISLMQKVAFALVPGTGFVWVVVEYIIRSWIQ